MITAATLKKELLFNTAEKLDLLQTAIMEGMQAEGWSFLAWAFMANHYHVLVQSPEDPSRMSQCLGKIHMQSAKRLNALDGKPGRRVWYQFWDSQITYEKSFLARIHYVLSNPVRHGLVHDAKAYPWCSAAWFVESASPALVNTVRAFKSDQIDDVECAGTTVLSPAGHVPPLQSGVVPPHSTPPIPHRSP